MTAIRSKPKIKSQYDLERLAGKWVAFVNGRVVAFAPTLPLLMQKLRGMRFGSKPSVMLVPRKDEGPYILAAL